MIVKKKISTHTVRKGTKNITSLVLQWLVHEVVSRNQSFLSRKFRHQILHSIHLLDHPLNFVQRVTPWPTSHRLIIASRLGNSVRSKICDKVPTEKLAYLDHWNMVNGIKRNKRIKEVKKLILIFFVVYQSISSLKGSVKGWNYRPMRGWPTKWFIACWWWNPEFGVCS